MAVNIESLKTFFIFDAPIPYLIDKTEYKYIHIYPVMLKDSLIFLSSCDVLTIEKDEIDSVEIIQMSYLEFLVKEKFKEDIFKQKLFYTLNLCLNMKDPRVFEGDNHKFYIYDKETDMLITAKQFEDIRRIIMYQNIFNYDDTYINPDLRKSIEETKDLKMQGIDPPDLERKISIITAHTGVVKQEQLKMSLREHEALFQEVCGEVDFLTTRPIALYSNKAEEYGHWIFRKKKGKFDGYLSLVDNVTSKFGTGIVPT